MDDRNTDAHSESSTWTQTQEGDVTAAFIYAGLGKDKKVFFDMPWWFEAKGKNGRTKVLKWFKTLYGLRQSPRVFWKYMTFKITLCGMVQSKMDPCLFIGKKVIEMI